MLELRAQRATCEWISVNSGYSSVGRASDCRLLQQSDGPWFDSGWPDFFDAGAGYCVRVRVCVCVSMSESGAAAQ